MTLEKGNDMVPEQKIMKCSILKSQYQLQAVYEENSNLKRIKSIFVDANS